MNITKPCPTARHKSCGQRTLANAMPGCTMNAMQPLFSEIITEEINDEGRAKSNDADRILESVSF